MPRAAVFDAETVHLLSSVIPADLPDLISQVLQQVRQICLPGDLHFRIRKPIVCACLRIVHLLSKNKKPPGGTPFSQGASPGGSLAFVFYSGCGISFSSTSS